jgi:hypothetical protein
MSSFVRDVGAEMFIIQSAARQDHEAHQGRGRKTLVLLARGDSSARMAVIDKDNRSRHGHRGRALPLISLDEDVFEQHMQTNPRREKISQNLTTRLRETNHTDRQPHDPRQRTAAWG